MIQYLDDYREGAPHEADLGEPDTDGVTWRMTLAAEIEEAAAAHCDPGEAVVDADTLIGWELRRLAARVRATGIRTVEELNRGRN